MASEVSGMLVFVEQIHDNLIANNFMKESQVGQFDGLGPRTPQPIANTRVSIFSSSTQFLP